jgi:hypothetical protein
VTMLPITDLKVIQKSTLINWDGKLGLDVFDSWQELLECFCGHGDFLKFCKREFLVVNHV